VVYKATKPYVATSLIVFLLNDHFVGPGVCVSVCVDHNFSNDTTFGLDIWHAGSTWHSPGPLKSSRSTFKVTWRKMLLRR